jgi:hypothetical protein
MSHDFHLFSHETSVNMVLSMCQSHIFSGWNFEKSQKNKKNIASDTFKNTYFAPFWKQNPDLVKNCQDKKPLSWTFSQLWHQWKPSLIRGIVGSVQVFWQFVSHWVVGFPGHYTTPHQTSWPQCGNNHMHAFTYSCSCFAQEFECPATEPQKNQILCSASKELNLHQASFWDNGNYLLVADFYSLYCNNFLFF